MKEGKMMKNYKKLYIAYGSNLNVEQMAKRCPTATIYATGVLEDFRLAFKGGVFNGYLTIEPAKGSKVPVVIWRISELDEVALDQFEGYPKLYMKKEMPFKLDHEIQDIGFAYIMNEGFNYKLPTETYLNTIEKGYNDFHFDYNAIVEAYKYSAVKLNII